MGDWRTVETRLAKFSLWALVIFAPVESYASWVFVGRRVGFLIHPGFLHSVVGMVLLAVGAFHSLNARPRRAPGLMCASHAWWAATGWTSTQLRLEAIARGAQMHFGARELWFVVLATTIAFGAFALSLLLTYKAAAARDRLSGTS